jgi:hypothetical protein
MCTTQTYTHHDRIKNHVFMLAYMQKLAALAVHSLGVCLLVVGIELARNDNLPASRRHQHSNNTNLYNRHFGNGVDKVVGVGGGESRCK